MAISEQTRLRFERTGFAALAAIIGISLIAFEIMPKTERALLLKNDVPFQAKAFSASVTPLDPRLARVEGDTLNRLAALSDITRRRNLAGRRRADGGTAGSAPNRQLFADAGPAPFAGQAPDTAPNLASPGPPASTDGLGTSGGSSSSGGPPAAGQPGPLGAAPGTNSTTSSTSSSTTSTSSTSTGSSGSTSTGSTSTSSSGSTTPVSSVPEPGTWLTMLLGFFMMGAAIRRTSKPKPTRIIADRI